MTLKKGDKVGYAVKPKPPLHVLAGGEHWWCIEVFAGSEEHFQKKIGEAIYFPRKTIWRMLRKSQRNGGPARQRRTVPLIEGYVFLNGDINHAYHDWLESDKKFVGILSMMGVASPVRPAQIERLKVAEEALDYDETRKVFSSIIGTTVEVQKGALAGKMVFVRDFDDGKFTVQPVGDKMVFKISVSNLEKIGN